MRRSGVRFLFPAPGFKQKAQSSDWAFCFVRPCRLYVGKFGQRSPLPDWRHGLTGAESFARRAASTASKRRCHSSTAPPRWRRVHAPAPPPLRRAFVYSARTPCGISAQYERHALRAGKPHGEPAGHIVVERPARTGPRPRRRHATGAAPHAHDFSYEIRQHEHGILGCRHQAAARPDSFNHVTVVMVHAFSNYMRNAGRGTFASHIATATPPRFALPSVVNR